jgi:hypothetical protein
MTTSLTYFLNPNFSSDNPIITDIIEVTTVKITIPKRIFLCNNEPLHHIDNKRNANK